MTTYRLVYQDPSFTTSTVLREEYADSDAEAAMKMLVPHPEYTQLRPNLSPPRRDHFVVLEKQTDDGWERAESIRRTRGGWA